MRNITMRASVACLLGLFAAATCQAAVKNNYIAPEARAFYGGRDVYIAVAQAEIKPNINISNLTAAAGGGLLFALIDAGVNNARAKDAEIAVVPLREALVGYEFDPQAQFATSATLAGLGWFDPKQVKFAKDDSVVGVLAAVDAAGTPQLLSVRYSYETNADFSAIVVNLGVSLINKHVPAGKKPTARMQSKYLPYNQSFRSFIKLPGADPEKPERNVQAWAADGGKLARAALDLGLERCQTLLVRGMTQNAEDAAANQKRNKRPMSSEPGVLGWQIDHQPTYTVVFESMTGSLAQIETIDPAKVAATPAAAPAPVAESAPAAESAPVSAPAPAETGAPAADETPASPAAPAAEAPAAASTP